MNQIRILHVVGQMDVGGVQLIIMNYFRSINRKLVQFDFVIWGDKAGCFEKEIISMGGRIYRVTTPSTSFIRHNIDLRKVFLENSNSIIHLHHCFGSIFAALQAQLAGGRIIISHAHAANETRSPIKKIIRISIRVILNRICDYKLACSYDAAVCLYGKRAVKKNRVMLIRNAINIEKYIFNQRIRDQKRKEMGIDDYFVVGHVGRFSSVKNHSFLLEIFRDLCSMNIDCRLVLVGEGALEEDIARKTRRLNLQDKVIFLGKRTDVNDLMQIFDLLIFPSINEGLGLTLIEAQATGLRCITSKSVPEEVNVTSLVEFISLNESSVYWAKEAQKLVQATNREDYSETMRKAGYDITQQAAVLEEFYLDAYRKKTSQKSSKNT